MTGAAGDAPHIPVLLEEVLDALAIVPGEIHVDGTFGAGGYSRAMLAAGAIDGLSIGYRTVRAERDGKGQRLLQELELWEVSLVTFPMLPEARVSAKGDAPDADVWRDVAALFDAAAKSMAGRS